MQNHERERKVKVGDGGGGDFVELPRPGRHPPCQLLSDLHYLSQNLSPSQTRCSSLRQLQQLHQLQLPQQPSQEGPSLTHLTMVQLPVERRRWSLARGLTPRISSLCAPFPRREGGSHCGLCSPLKSFHNILHLIWDAHFPNGVDSVNLCPSHIERSPVCFMPSLSSTCNPFDQSQKPVSPGQPLLAPSHSQLPSTGNPPQSRSRNLNPSCAPFLHSWAQKEAVTLKPKFGDTGSHLTKTVS